ncbi:unnamed protein product [Soboliphyme baturini]|uniref:WD_REPEATS_REGION domain-containing protein n=1 Tax=Soboliphyme baturini TaxID=241478 RepID=A0A183I9U6_9BILA|nr:unnamed protein product [Soboliphyme baturini]
MPHCASFSVGEDGFTRAWSVRTGEFLCAVPPPYPVLHRDLVPRICCSNNWGGLYGNLGLCLAVRDEMHVYELKT